MSPLSHSRSCTSKFVHVNQCQHYTKSNSLYVIISYLLYLSHHGRYCVQSENVISPQAAKSVRESYKAYLTEELAQSDSFKPEAQMLHKQWNGLVWPASEDAVGDPETGVDPATLVNVGKASVDVPEGFVSVFMLSAGDAQAERL